MKVISSCISVIFLTSLLFGQASFHHTEMKMGCRFDITVVAIGQEEADRFLEIALDEIDRIEKLISSWDESSQTSAINRKAGIAPVKVDRELFELIKRCIGLSELTSGAFDISYASMDKIWRYDGSMKEMPSQQEIRNSVSNVGFDKIVLDDSESTVFLPDPGMKIGFGAIGKGYAADRTKSLLKEHGVESAIVNASGDLNAWGQQANGENWKVAITNPLNKSKAFAWLPVQDRAVVTSGNYEKYVILDGKQYSHIIDPRTGYPCEGISSVTVFAPKAELADALSTAVFILGVETGLYLIDQLPSIDCIIVDSENKIHTSLQLEIEYEEKTK